MSATHCQESRSDCHCSEPLKTFMLAFVPLDFRPYTLICAKGLDMAFTSAKNEVRETPHKGGKWRFSLPQRPLLAVAGGDRDLNKNAEFPWAHSQEFMVPYFAKKIWAYTSCRFTSFPPMPLHSEQMTFLCTANVVVWPLSKVFESHLTWKRVNVMLTLQYDMTSMWCDRQQAQSRTIDHHLQVFISLIISN